MANRSRSTTPRHEDGGGFRPIEVPIPVTSRPLIVSAVEPDGTPIADDSGDTTPDTPQES